MQYSIISNVCCKISSAGVISKINGANCCYYVPFNISGFARCGKNVLLALDKRDIVYEFNFEIKEPFSNLNLINLSVEDWSDINKRNELHVETSRHAINQIKHFIHENNVSFVGLITLILSFTVIGCWLFLCYYFKCYFFVYFKLLKFY